MPHSPGPSEEAVSGRSNPATTGPARNPPSAPETPPPGLSEADPIAPATHVDGGTYAKHDYSPAARRSEVHVDQLERPPGPDAEGAQHSGFATAEDLEGPATVAGGQ